MIRYVVGDATEPQGPGQKIIAHIVNDAKGWGRGFVVAISKRWQLPEDSYRYWAKTGFDTRAGEFTLGNVQVVQVGEELFVANMIAQHGYGNAFGPPIRYESLRTCLAKIATVAADSKASIHMPRIGTGLAGGTWAQIEPIIRTTCKDLDVLVYDLPRK